MSVLCDVCAGAIISNFQHVSDRNCALVLGLRFNMLMKQSQEVYKKKKKKKERKRLGLQVKQVSVLCIQLPSWCYCYAQCHSFSGLLLHCLSFCTYFKALTYVA